MHTIEESRSLWCPMVRVARVEGDAGREVPPTVIGGCNSASGVGQGPRNPASSRCIADSCAMWRWNAPASRQELIEGIPVRGYCGLAGRPEAWT